MSKKFYNALTWVKIILGILIPIMVGLNEIWSIPYGYQILQTLTVIEGAVIAVQKVNSDEFFKDKEIVQK